MMKKITTVFLSFLLLSNLSGFSQQVDTSFYNYGWIKMKDNGEDYRSIQAAADLYYSDTSKRNKSYKYHHYQRWNQFWRNRVYSSPEDIDAGKYGLFYHHARNKAALFNSNFCTSNHLSSNWESWGFDTHPYTSASQSGTPSRSTNGGMGVMFTVVPDTTDHSYQTLYAGSPIGGIWKTTDQGLNWFNISDNTNLPSMAITHIAIDPFDNQHLLVSTGNNWNMDPPGIGVIESKDGGQSWTETGLQNDPQNASINDNVRVSKVYFHPTDTNKYFAVVRNHVKISLDKGVTWDSILPINIPDSTVVENFKFHPSNANIIYCCTKQSGANLYKSVNGGSSWITITQNFTSATSIEQINIDVIPSQPNNLYVGITAKNPNKFRFYKSTDEGNTSTRINTEQHVGSVHPGLSKGVFMVHPNNDNIVIYGNINLRRSVNGGTSFYDFSSLTLNQMHGDIRGGMMSGNYAFVATDGGISISSNGGANWTNRYNGLNVQQPYGHDVDKDFKYLQMGAQDIGGYRYDIKAKKWLHTLLAGDGGVPIFSLNQPNVVITNNFDGFSNTGNNGLSRSVNSGFGFWGFPNNSTRPHFNEKHDVNRPLDVDLHGNFYMGYEDLYKTSNNGDNWYKISDFENDHGKNVHPDHQDAIIAVAVSKVDSAVIAIGFEEQTYGTTDIHTPCSLNQCPEKKFFITTNGGATWHDRTRGNLSGQLNLDEAPISDIIFSEHDPAKIWVTTGGYWMNNKVYYSPDTGHTWINQSYNLPNYVVHSIVYQANSNDRLFVATDIGVFTKDAAMNNWECYNNNLPATYCVDLDVNNCGGALTVSGHGRGMWKSPLPPNRLIGNITWDGHRTVGSDIIVQDTLTITGTVEMAYNTKITVEVGGKLIVDGGTLTSSHCIDSLWQGVELLGDIRYHQTGDPMSAGFTQGYLKMTNGGIIENAEVGIYAGSLSSEDYGGGLIVTEDSAMIRNCRTGVYVSPYGKLNKSTFTNTTFINDGTLLDPLTGTALKTDVHVSINGMTVVGNEFNDCIFENQNLALLPYDRGIGLDVTGRKVGTTNNPMLEACNFIGLHYGVQAGNLSSGVGNDMEYNTFTNTQRGIYVFAGYSLDLHNNTFNLPEATVEDVYGIKLNACENFDIRGNSVLGSSSPSQGTYFNSGIVIENSSDAGGIVFDNTIGNGQHLEVGIQAQGENQSLTIRCNDIEYQGTNPHGLAVYDYFVSFGGQIQAYNPAQLRDQGHPNCLGNNASEPNPHKAAAGNEWKNLCNSGTDQEIDMEPGMTFKYYFHTENIVNLPTTDPDCSDPNWNSNPNLYVDCFTNKQASSCNDLYTPPTSGGGGGGSGPGGGGLFRMKGGADSSEVALFEQRYVSAVHQQQALESNISQQAALQAILHYTTSSKQNLIAASPLSDGLLVAAIEEWSTNHPADLKAVLLENVSLSKEVITALQKAQLAHLWQAAIQQANPTHALRDSLVKAADQLRFAKKELMLKEAQVYRKLQADGKSVEAEELLENSQLSASLRLLCKEYISLGEFSKANDLLTNIETKTDDGEAQRNQNFVRFSRTVIPIYQNGKSGRVGATMDEAQVSAALEKLPREHTVEGNEVEALRELWNKEFFHHPVMRKARQSNAIDFGSAQSEKLLQNLSIFPNPASGSATIVYDLKGSNTATIQFFDAMGKQVKELNLLPEIQKQEIDLSTLNSGVYHFSVLLKGERLFNGKLIITQ